MTTLYATSSGKLSLTYTTSDDYPHLGDPGVKGGWCHLLRVADREDEALIVLLFHLRHYQYKATDYPDIIDREVKKLEVEGYKICLIEDEGKFGACTMVSND